MKRFLISALLGAAALLIAPGFSQAQRISVGRGYGGGYGGPGGYGLGGYSPGGYGFRNTGIGIGISTGNSPYYDRGFGGYGLGGYGVGGYGVGGYGLGGYGYNRGYNYVPSYSSSYGGYGVSPYYSGYAAPSTGYYSGQAAPAYGSPATVEVFVPADAEVWIDGQPTQQRGETRTFSTPALEQGRSFSYEISARWMQDGKPVEQKRQAQLSSGTRVTVDFRKP